MDKFDLTRIGMQETIKTLRFLAKKYIKQSKSLKFAQEDLCKISPGFRDDEIFERVFCVFPICFKLELTKFKMRQ